MIRLCYNIELTNTTIPPPTFTHLVVEVDPETLQGVSETEIDKRLFPVNKYQIYHRFSKQGYQICIGT